MKRGGKEEGEKKSNKRPRKVNFSKRLHYTAFKVEGGHNMLC